MSNVKPNDLAMVVNAPSPWGGATCKVLSHEPNPVTDGITDPNIRIGCAFWNVEFPRPMPLWSETRGVIEGRHCCMPDAHLRKIGGPDVSVDAMQFNPLAHEQTA